MPVITFEAGPMEPDKKEALIREFTKTASEITNIPEESFIVTIRELPFDNIGVGGKTLTSIIEERNSSV